MAPDRRTYLITGANTGIGRAAALAIGDLGGKLVLASRSEERTLPVLEALRARGAEAEFLPLDLGDLGSVRACAERFLASGQPLDVLINNAGLAGASGQTRDGFEITIGTNHLGPFLLTEWLLPKLQEAPQGRVVNVASRAHVRVRGIRWEDVTGSARSALDRGRLYGVSKLMNVLHARQLAERLKGSRVTTYALHPGVVASDLWRHMPWPIGPLIRPFMIGNEEGAETTVRCATDPALAGESGRYYDRAGEARPSKVAQDPALAQELYERSLAWVRPWLSSETCPAPGRAIDSST